VSFHPSVPCVALATGERKFYLQKAENETEEENRPEKKRKTTPPTRNRVLLLSLPSVTHGEGRA